MLIFRLCHPEGIFAVVGTAFPSKCKDPYPNGIPFRDRMTDNRPYPVQIRDNSWTRFLSLLFCGTCRHHLSQFTIKEE
jgi:hypothetical protein